jgi:hypothetical protein
LLIGFFEIRLPFIKTPSDVIVSHHHPVEEKKIKKFVRRRALLNKYHIGFINLLTPDYTSSKVS